MNNKNNNEITNTENDEITNNVSEVKSKKRKSFSLKQVIIAVVIAVIAVVVICLSVTFAVNDVNPFTYISSIVTNDEAHLIGKWQSQSAPGISAYVFYEDGTYDSYISSFNFQGEYETKGDKLILKNTRSEQEVVYKYSVIGKTLSMTLIEDNGTKIEDDETLKFDSVDTLNQKSIADIIGDLKSDSTTEKEE